MLLLPHQTALRGAYLFERLLAVETRVPSMHEGCMQIAINISAGPYAHNGRADGRHSDGSTYPS